MASSNSSLSRKRPVKWIGHCGRCDGESETVETFVENPAPNGMFCPIEGETGGLRGVMHFRPMEDQTPEMIPQDIGVNYLPIMMK
jgi:hypothetical protein